VLAATSADAASKLAKHLRCFYRSFTKAYRT
jgi:hypothetical protein